MNKAKNFLRKLYRKFWYEFFKVLCLLPIWGDVIVFESFLGRNFNDSPKAIYLYMKEHYPEYKIVWFKDRNSDIDFGDAKTIDRLTPMYFIYCARAKYIVNNSRMPIFFKKRKDQVYVQTWHGTPLKRLVYDMETNVMPGTDKERYLKNFSKEVANWDYLISPNNYSTERFKTAFRFEKQFLEVGYPRNEFLHNHTPEDRQKIRSRLGINDEDTVILYTPTYRDSKNEGKAKYFQEMELDLEQLNNTEGVKVLLRVHYLIAKAIDVSKYQNIIDVSSYRDINDLFIASDMLLNDYSSTMFDYLILNKPIVLFPYDLDEYANDIRGFYMNYNSLPAEQIEDTTRLVEIAQNLEGYQAVWKDEMDNFRNQMVLDTEFEASKHVVEAMLATK